MNLMGQIVISEESIRVNLPKHEREEYKQFEDLRGKSISLREASRKYKITPPTLHRWAKLGYIARLGKDGNKLLLDEADVAYCAFIYNTRAGKQGKWTFHPNGTPYIPKTK